MPYYYFEAVTAEGKIQKKLLKARDKSDADTRLRASGLRPMLIENYRAKKRKKKRKALHTRHIIRNTLAVVSGISLVGGVAAYLIILDINSIKSDRLTVEKLSSSGIISGTSPSAIVADSPAERRYASEVLGLLNTNYPEWFSGAEVRRKTVMVIFARKGKANFSDEALESISSMIANDFHREFNTSNCTVYINYSHDEPLAESRYRRGKVITELY